MSKKKTNRQRDVEEQQRGNLQSNQDKLRQVSIEEYDKLARQEQQKRSKKPGSEHTSNDKGRHHTGRGGGK